MAGEKLDKVGAPIDVTATPEFKAAVDQAVEKATQGLTEKILAQLADGGAQKGGDQAFAQGLALAISQLANQGVGRDKIVAPEVLAARDAARQRMVDLIIDARKAGDIPAYQLKQKIYIGERLVEPVWIDPQHVQRATEIDFDGVPNHAMIPVNEIATRIFEEFMASVGSPVMVKAENGVSEFGEDARELSVTARGLVVRGGSQSMEMRGLKVGSVGEREAPHTGAGGSSDNQNLRLRGRNQPGAVREIAVLGTVAAPARQQA